MNTPKRQHTIPIVHLKHFVSADPKGQVWTIEKDTGEARSATPENTSVVSHFYSVQKDDGSFDTTLEEALAEIEGAAAPVYDKLLSGQMLSDEEREAFAAFLAMMYFADHCEAFGYSRHHRPLHANHELRVWRE